MSTTVELLLTRGGSRNKYLTLPSPPNLLLLFQLAETNGKTKEPTAVIHVPVKKGAEWICRGSQRIKHLSLLFTLALPQAFMVIL